MEEMISAVFSVWKQYWGEGLYPYLLFAAALYLFLFHRKKAASRQMLLYTTVFLFLFFFPASAWIIQRCIGPEVYWRVLWLLPVVPLVAYAGTEFVEGFGKSRILQGTAFLAVIVLIVCCGKSVWQAGNYTAVHNYPQVPDEAAQVCRLVNEQKETDETLYLAADDYLAAYIRVYDPSIYMPYSRGGKGAAHAASLELYQELSAPSPNGARVGELAKKLGCNYLTCAALSGEQQALLEQAGYYLLGTMDRYAVYKLENGE